MILNGIDKAESLVAEGEVSTILANFNSSYIYDVVSDLMDDRYNSFSIIPKSNFIDELELSFKQLYEQFPSDKDNIYYVRFTIYNEVVNIISNKSGVKFVIEDPESVDIYYFASCVFDLFISRYNDYVFNFLYNFIVTQKDFIYNQLNLSTVKKSKDISTLYNKEYYSNDVLAVISARLYTSIDFITGLDFDAQTTLGYMYSSTGDKSKIEYLSQFIDSSADLFKIMILPILKNDSVCPSIVSAIKMELQKNFKLTKETIF